MQNTSIAPSRSGTSVRWPAKTRAVGDAERLRLRAKARGQVAVAHDQQARPRLALQHARRGLEQEGVALLRAQPADRAEDQRPRREARAAPQRERPLARHRGELVERRAVPDQAHALARHEALAHQEVARRAAHRDGAVGVAAQQAVGERLVARHARVGEVLVQHEPRAGGARREPAEVGGGVAVDVQDARAARAHEGDEVGEDARIEAAAAEVVHRDALLAQPARSPAPGCLSPHERRRRSAPGRSGGTTRRTGATRRGCSSRARRTCRRRGGPGRPSRQAPADGAGSGVPRASQTTAPESESSTIRPAPTRLKARALSRGRPTWAK